jgi:hypothetical protein
MRTRAMSAATVTAEEVGEIGITMMNMIMEAEVIAEQAAGTMKTMTTTDAVMLEAAVVKTRTLTKTTIGGERDMMKMKMIMIMAAVMLETAVMKRTKTMIARAAAVIVEGTREGASAA